MFNPDFGLFNEVLKGVGLAPWKWTYGEGTVIPSLILMSAWGFGNVMVIFLAGLQGVPKHLYEALAVDGGNQWHAFTRITLPMMSPTIFYCLVTVMIASFQTFYQAYVMTNGGPNAQAVDIPMTTANRRLTRLLEPDGVRLQCRVSPAALGYRFLVGVSIQVRESARELAAALSHLPAAMWVSEITGTHAVTVELLAREQSDIDEAIATIRADRRAGAITLDYYALPIKSTGRW